MPNCEDCGNECRGKRCRTCYSNRNNGHTDATQLDLQELISTQNVDLNESGIPGNINWRILSNPSFKNGSLADIEYVVAQEKLDDTVSDYSDVTTEKFSLIKLITSVVRRETASLRKKIEEFNTTNKLLKEELDSLKTVRLLSRVGLLAPA